jgi:hypothetical protein
MPEPWGELTRPEAVALFWAMASRIAQQIAELRQLRAFIAQRWGRAPRLPTW